MVGGPRYELPGRRQGRPVRAGELVAAGLDEPGVRALVGRGDPPEGAEGGGAVGRAAAGEGPEDAVEEGVAAAVDRRGPVRPDRGGGAPGRSARRRRVELLQQPLGEVGEVRLVLGPLRLGLLRGRPLLLPPLLELGLLLPLPRLPLALPLDLCVSCIRDERRVEKQDYTLLFGAFRTALGSSRPSELVPPRARRLVLSLDPARRAARPKNSVQSLLSRETHRLEGPLEQVLALLLEVDLDAALHERPYQVRADLVVLRRDGKEAASGAGEKRGDGKTNASEAMPRSEDDLFPNTPYTFQNLTLTSSSFL